MIKKVIIVLIGLALILAVIIWYGFSTPTNDIEDLTISSSSKPVVFLLIDSLMDEPLQKAMEEGRTPALTFLAEHGQYFPQIVSSYPTMSVTIDSTLLTGTYANKHRIPALAWYNAEEKRLVNYGSSSMEVFKLGAEQVLHDNAYNLNQEHLSKNTSTIFEDLYERQDQSASINGLVYRGNQQHNLHIPNIISTFNLLPNTVHVKGPTFLSMGSLSQFSSENNKFNNIWPRMGFNDNFTANELKNLIQNDMLPAFTLAYFPSLDKQVHENGPMHLDGIEQVDQQIQSILNEYPTWEEAIKNTSFIVYGDSGQAVIGEDEEESFINLKTLSEKYQVSELGGPIHTEDQVILGVNSRMAYIYLLDENITYQEMISHFIEDPRIGFIAWKDNKGNHVLTEESDSKLTFQPNGNYTDQYQQNWELTGDFSALDLSVNNKNRIEYGEYPDALARLYGALHSHQGRYLIVDAKPGHEFIGEHSPTHPGGGGHGSLHEDDSLTPLIITGTNKTPKHRRTVDFKEWILELTNIQK
ncbi:alkaline phosphatase family protein [Oceanobacillus jeddahense]|uniref:Alkaline phosphatase family protein n=1 Tax=Oceanobacillus jeddahense TaxID=1462527 RepID=A0ABY5JY56_9BACI|nr:alkaline phosphatase family protein [Oceanobacillus jeddahense]UUI04996.1 alkaline phosphatase family protein [Oceanobacillus jeddahense]